MHLFTHGPPLALIASPFAHEGTGGYPAGSKVSDTR